jgi:hypothetical protein
VSNVFITFFYERKLNLGTRSKRARARAKVLLVNKDFFTA